jgi:protein TonB
MSVQPAPPLPRRPATGRPHARRVRVDPPNTFHATHHFILREPARPAWIETDDPALAQVPLAPLGAVAPPAARRPNRWLTAALASIALHAAVAAVFLIRGEDEGVQIAGSQEAGVAMFGDSAADMLREEAEDSTSVTIIPITTATPVETVTAAEVQPVDAVEPVTETHVAEAETPVLEPVREIAEVEPEHPSVAPPVAASAAPAARAETAEPVPSQPTPDVLAVDTVETVPDDEAVAPVAAQPVTETPPERLAETPPDIVAAERPAEPVAETAPAPPVAETAPEPPVAETPEPPAKPFAAAKPPVETKAPAPKPTRKTEAKAERKPAKTETPARKADATRAAGSGGASKADGRKGVADGEAAGTRADKAGAGKASAAGNAAVTNYPGKVRGKISRAVSRISRRDRAGADGDVTVAFTVTASGALGGLGIARSSGSAALDQAARAAVRRAAPFPPIPEGAGRSTWQFTIPLGLAR